MADDYTEKKNPNAEQNAQRSNRPANMLEYIERERQQFKTDLMQGMREAFAEALKGSEVTVINSNKPKEDSNV